MSLFVDTFLFVDNKIYLYYRLIHIIVMTEFLTFRKMICIVVHIKTLKYL